MLGLLLLAPLASAVDADLDGYPAVVDCDDSRADVNPGEVEVCHRELGVDEDCDGTVDDADRSVRLEPYWHEDLDADGAPGAFVLRACAGPPGMVRRNSGVPDCDDLDPVASNGLALWYPDADADGVPAGSGWVQACHPPGPTGWMLAQGSSDCRDDDPTISPDEPEVCDDGVDQDCRDGDEVCPWWDHVISGTSSSQGFGDTITVVDDATGDGVPDLWVTGPSTDEAWLMAGPLDRDQTDDDAHLVLTPADPNGSDWLDELESEGDLDQDGLADLVVGSAGVRVGFADRAGAVYLIRGGGSGTRRVDAAARTVLQGTVFGMLGAEVAIGDWNGGRPEVFASAPYDSRRADNAGAVLVTSRFPAGAASFDTLAEARIEGAQNERLGEVLLLAEDTNGDGADDLLVGGFGAVDAYLFRTAPVGTVDATDADVLFVPPPGWSSVAPMEVADLDGDGAAELLYSVGGPGGANELRAVAATTDGTDLDSPIGQITTDATVDTVADVAVGDLDGDGVDDLAVGFAESGTQDHNGVWVFAGPLGGLRDASTADRLLDGPHDDDAATRVQVADLDADGVDDLLVGSPRWFYREPDVPGLVYVVAGPLF